MADANTMTTMQEQDKKTVFPFFKLSRELRNIVYRGMAGTTRIEGPWWEQFVHTLFITGNPIPKLSRVSRQFKSELIEETHLAGNRVMIVIDPEDAMDFVEGHNLMRGFDDDGEDDTIRLFNCDYKDNLGFERVYECKVTISMYEGYKTATYGRNFSEEDPEERVCEKLRYILKTFPNIRTLTLEIETWASKKASAYRELGPYNPLEKGPVRYLDITKSRLGFEGEFNIVFLLTWDTEQDEGDGRRGKAVITESYIRGLYVDPRGQAGDAKAS